MHNFNIIIIVQYHIFFPLLKLTGKNYVIVNNDSSIRNWSILTAIIFIYDVMNRVLIVKLTAFDLASKITRAKTMAARTWHMHLNVFQGRPRNCVNLFIVHSLSPADLRLWLVHSRHHWYVQLTTFTRLIKIVGSFTF